MEFALPDPGDNPSFDTMAHMKEFIESFEEAESDAITLQARQVYWLKINAMLTYIALATDERLVNWRALYRMETPGISMAEINRLRVREGLEPIAEPEPL